MAVHLLLKTTGANKKKTIHQKKKKHNQNRKISPFVSADEIQIKIPAKWPKTITNNGRKSQKKMGCKFNKKKINIGVHKQMQV